MLELKDGVAVLLTVKSLPKQTCTVLLSLPVVLEVSVLKLAVLGCVVQVPARSVNVLEYVNVFGLASVYNTVPRAPPRVSVTVTLPSFTVGVTVLNVTGAVPFAEPSVV